MATGSTGSSGAPATSGFAAQIGGVGASPMFNDTRTNTTYLTQTSQPDIASMVNATMQQLLGRNATPAEIAQYGSELLAAEKANPGLYKGLTTYGATGKRNTVTGEQISAGVDPAAFLSTLIQGTGQAKDYKMATGYLDAMTQANQEYKGAYNG